MKSFFVLAATTVAVANAALCDLGQLAPLLSDADVVQCKADTGLNPPVPPTADVLPKLCGNKACLAALAKLKALKVGDCTIGTVALETNFLGPIESYCAKATPASTPAPATTTTAPAGSSPSPTTAAPGSSPAPTTKAPTTTTNSTTPAPAKTTASSGSKSGSDTTIEEGKGSLLSPSGSSSASGDATIKTPSKTTSAPTPTPAKSGASSLAFAASAVVLAVAASFM